MNLAAKLQGLYAITDHRLCPPNSIFQKVEDALRGGAKIIQYRDKSHDLERRLAQARGLMKLCTAYDALLIINDDVSLAKHSCAHGVHLGKDDHGLASARDDLGKDAIIGISCYNRLEPALQASSDGADYVAFGRFFPSLSKPDALKASPDLLTDAKRTLRIPLVAIGGITPENGAPLIKAGADMLAVIHGVFDQPNIEVASRRLSALFMSEEKNK
jgi:thiamine-phosphate pyrophosphorylase